MQPARRRRRPARRLHDTRIARTPGGRSRLHVDALGPGGAPTGWDVDIALVVVGVRPDTDLLVDAGATTGPRGAVVVDDTMTTGVRQAC